MSNGDHEVELAVLKEWRTHVDRELVAIRAEQQSFRKEQRENMQAVRSDIATLSRNVGRPLLSWPQVLTLTVALLGTFAAIAALIA